jgi:hypothetical protein
MLKIDPEGYFNFDLASGRISYTRDKGDAIIIPLEAIKSFSKASPDEEPHQIFYILGLHVGKHFGKTLAQIYDGRGMEENIAPEDFLNNLNAILTLHGFGLMNMETWGNVLVFEWDLLFKSKLLTSSFQEGIIAGILREFSKQEFDVATLENGMRERGKFLAGNAQMIKFTRQWIEEGASTGEIVMRLKNGQHLRQGGQVGNC